MVRDTIPAKASRSGPRRASGAVGNPLEGLSREGGRHLVAHHRPVRDPVERAGPRDGEDEPGAPVGRLGGAEVGGGRRRGGVAIAVHVPRGVRARPEPEVERRRPLQVPAPEHNHEWEYRSGAAE